MIRLSCCSAFGSLRFEYVVVFFRRFICQFIYFDLNSQSLRNSCNQQMTSIETYSTQLSQRIEFTDCIFYFNLTQIPEIAKKRPCMSLISIFVWISYRIIFFVCIKLLKQRASKWFCWKKRQIKPEKLQNMHSHCFNCLHTTVDNSNNILTFFLKVFNSTVQITVTAWVHIWAAARIFSSFLKALRKFGLEVATATQIP